MNTTFFHLQQYDEKQLNILADGMYTPGRSGYVNKLVFTQSMPIPEFRAKYKGLQPEKLDEFYDHCLAGKLMSKVYSSDSIAYDLIGFGGQDFQFIWSWFVTKGLFWNIALQGKDEMLSVSFVNLVAWKKEV
uniref:uncharacterized protein LOC122586348 isoform X2 n=1 Tax=Erigeron canadensis TaxID=72917 RepID=UPI001CB8B169|nr:uncharacterized protein LOC122586348 isoform X2 [Erigeron canadensis]